MHFVNKVTALGYQLFKHKDAGQAYGIYAMEMEGGDVGMHLGGTGKSPFSYHPWNRLENSSS